jgi:hypothetical protein
MGQFHEMTWRFFSPGADVSESTVMGQTERRMHTGSQASPSHMDLLTSTWDTGGDMSMLTTGMTKQRHF